MKFASLKQWRNCTLGELQCGSVKECVSEGLLCDGKKDCSNGWDEVCVTETMEIIAQVLAGQTNGGVLTSTTYHGGVKVAGFPYTKVAAVPAVSYAAAYPYAHAGVYYGKREAEAEPWIVGQIAAGAHALGKREAEAEADPAQVYSAYLYAHYPYHGKREAEAEADPAQVYSAPYWG